MKGKSILIYCQFLHGIGHLMRMLALRDSLGDEFEVTILCGGPIPQNFNDYEKKGIVALTPLLGDLKTNVPYSPEGKNLSEVWLERKREISNIVDSDEFDILITEMFPFGRKHFTDEILSLIRSVRIKNSSIRIMCALPDFIERKRLEHYKKIYRILNTYFHEIIVFSDQSIISLDESVPNLEQFWGEINYLGYIRPKREAMELIDNYDVIVSIGGGRVGEEVEKFALNLALEKKNWSFLFLGGLLSELDQRFQLPENIRYVRPVKNLKSLLEKAKLSISQGGYNTVLDIVEARVPALILPYEEITEQNFRARRLKQLGMHIEIITDANQKIEIDNFLRKKSFQIPLKIENGSGCREHFARIWL